MFQTMAITVEVLRCIMKPTPNSLFWSFLCNTAYVNEHLLDIELNISKIWPWNIFDIRITKDAILCQFYLSRNKYFKHNYIMWFSRIWQFFGSRLSIITKLSIARVSISTLLSVAKCYVSSTWFVEVIGFIYPSGQCYFHLDLLQRKMLIVESMRWYPLNIAFRNSTRYIRRQRTSMEKDIRLIVITIYLH